MKLRKIIKVSLWVLIPLGVLIALGSRFSGNKKQQVLPTVRTRTVETGSLEEFITAPGQIEPRSKVEISAKISARIVELPFAEGQQVSKGDVILRLDWKDLESQLRLAEAGRDAQKAQIEVEKASIKARKATLEGTEANLAQAQKDLQRHKSLYATHDVSEAAVDEAACRYKQLKSESESTKLSLESMQLNLEVMKHNLKAAEARVDQARETLGYTTITAPMAGVVIRVNAEVGEMVMTGTMNNPGTVIMELADLSEMILEAEIDEADVGKVQPGQKAIVRIPAYRDTRFEGQVKTICLKNDLSVNRTKYYKARILLDKTPVKLYSGLTADVDILTAVHENVLKVPSQSVLSREVDNLPKEIRDSTDIVDFKKAYTTVVYRLENGRAIVTPVKIGPSDLIDTVISDGLALGDRVISGPYKELERLSHSKAVKDENQPDVATDAQDRAGTEKTKQAQAETGDAQEDAENAASGS